MTNRIAIVLGVVIIAAIASDLYGNDGQALLFLSKKFSALIEYLAFWR